VPFWDLYPFEAEQRSKPPRDANDALLCSECCSQVSVGLRRLLAEPGRVPNVKHNVAILTLDLTRPEASGRNRAGQEPPGPVNRRTERQFRTKPLGVDAVRRRAACNQDWFMQDGPGCGLAMNKQLGPVALDADGIVRRVDDGIRGKRRVRKLLDRSCDQEKDRATIDACPSLGPRRIGKVRLPLGRASHQDREPGDASRRSRCVMLMNGLANAAGSGMNHQPWRAFFIPLALDKVIASSQRPELGRARAAG